jgi:hypothetical protein
LKSLHKELQDEKLTVVDQSYIIKKFNEKIGNKKPLLACASCGERNYANIYKEVRVVEDLQILRLSKIQMKNGIIYSSIKFSLV